MTRMIIPTPSSIVLIILCISLILISGCAKDMTEEFCKEETDGQAHMENGKCIVTEGTIVNNVYDINCEYDDMDMKINIILKTENNYTMEDMEGIDYGECTIKKDTDECLKEIAREYCENKELGFYGYYPPTFLESGYRFYCVMSDRQISKALMFTKEEIMRCGGIILYGN